MMTIKMCQSVASLRMRSSRCGYDPPIDELVRCGYDPPIDELVRCGYDPPIN